MFSFQVCLWNKEAEEKEGLERLVATGASGAISLLHIRAVRVNCESSPGDKWPKSKGQWE